MTKADLHELVDRLPEESLHAVGVLLRRAQDPAVAALDAAPSDDEQLTDEDRRAMEDAVHEPGVPWQQANEELRAG
jgi:hypothetical protein